MPMNSSNESWLTGQKLEVINEKLREQLDELETFEDATVGRELTMI